MEASRETGSAAFGAGDAAWPDSGTWSDGGVWDAARGTVRLTGASSAARALEPATPRDRPLADRKAQAAQLLREQAGLSDRSIGRQCGLSPATVASLRAAASHPEEDPSEGDGGTVRLGRDGRSRPVDGGALRHRIASAIQDDPDASLRTIARRVGASPETVRSVRIQLAQGDDPGPSVGTTRPTTAMKAVTHLYEPDDLLLRSRATPARTWQDDSACSSTSDGAAFAAWFEQHSLDGYGWREFVHAVPLSRVYEIVDEARRRSTEWTGFAQALEARVDRTTRIQRAI